LTLKAKRPASRVDYQTQRYSGDLKANAPQTITFKLTTRNGTNVKNK
jgi:hypothetical protein